MTTHLVLPSSFTRAKKLYWGLPVEVRDWVYGLGFDGIIDGLLEGPGKLLSRQATMTTLMERWSDCTHTFHFQFREITITPLDFTAIIGFAFIGQWIPFDILEDPAGLCRELLGYALEFRVGRGSLISYDRLW